MELIIETYTSIPYCEKLGPSPRIFYRLLLPQEIIVPDVLPREVGSTARLLRRRITG
jgi:hypothetical protein